MADATLAQIVASIHLGKWVKGETSEDSLKKFDWENYGWKEAALDALLYQCPDNVWRQKILTGHMDFH